LIWSNRFSARDALLATQTWEGLYPRFDGRGAEASCAWSWVTEHGTVLAQPTHTRGRLSHGVVAATIDTHLDKMLAAEPVPTPVQELG